MDDFMFGDRVKQAFGCLTENNAITDQVIA